MRKLLTLLMLFISLLSSAQNFINGDFENNTSSGCNYNLSNSSFNALMSNVVAYGPNEEVDIQEGSCYETAPSGDAFISLAVQNDLSLLVDAVTIELSGSFLAGHSYSISFYLKGNNDFGGFGDSIIIGVSNSSTDFGEKVFTHFPNLTQWEQISFTFVSPIDANYLSVQNQGLVYGWTFVDDFMINNPPQQVSFLASDTSLCQKFCISFSDSSTNDPIAWQWSFPGGEPSSSTAQNPSNICYDIPGVYDVTLITTNANGNDTLTLSQYITVHPTPPIPIITQNGTTLTSSEADFYQWQLDATDIPGATDQSYEVLQTGFYTVVVSDSSSCKNSATQYVELTGIDELSDANISNYPNPSNGNFVIDLQNVFSDEVLIEVVNALGQKLYSENISSDSKLEISLPGIAAGVYFLEIRSDDFFVKKKLIISK